MKSKMEKAAYLCLGAFITLGGYIFGTLKGNVEAQSELESREFKEVRCQKLEVVDSKGNVIVVLKENAGDEGGLVTVTGKDRKSELQLSGGSVKLQKGLSPGVVKLSVDDDGGHVFIGSIYRKTGISLLTDDEGSHVLINGKHKSGAVMLSATDSGNGGIVVVRGHSGGLAQLNGEHVVITNSSGQVVGQLYADKAGDGVIDIRDKSGKQK